MVFPGSFLLPPSQTLHSRCSGGSRKPSVQQQEDRTYPKSSISMHIDTARPPKISCTSVFDLNWTSGKLSMEAIQVVFEELRKKGNFLPFICLCNDDMGQSDVCFLKSGNLEWLDKNKSRCLVMWRRPEEWGKLIYQWVSQNTRTTTRG